MANFTASAGFYCFVENQMDDVTFMVYFCCYIFQNIPKFGYPKMPKIVVKIRFIIQCPKTVSKI